MYARGAHSEDSELGNSAILKHLQGSGGGVIPLGASRGKLCTSEKQAFPTVEGARGFTVVVPRCVPTCLDTTCCCSLQMHSSAASFCPDMCIFLACARRSGHLCRIQKGADRCRKMAHTQAYMHHYTRCASSGQLAPSRGPDISF